MCKVKNEATQTYLNIIGNKDAHNRNVQIADLKNKLLKVQDKALRLEDRIKELEEVVQYQAREINKHLADLIEKQKELNALK